MPTLSQMTTTDFEAIPAVGEPARTPGLVVMKFGGTSVGDTDKLKRVAERLVAAHEEGAKVVAVLSAMGKTTDELIRLAHEVSPRPHPREYDMLVSTGERISNALCAMAIHDLGHEAVSLTGSPGGDRHRRLATRRRRSSRCARSGSTRRSARTRSCWSPASRASRPRRTT